MATTPLRPSDAEGVVCVGGSRRSSSAVLAGGDSLTGAAGSVTIAAAGGAGRLRAGGAGALETNASGFDGGVASGVAAKGAPESGSCKIAEGADEIAEGAEVTVAGSIDGTRLGTLRVMGARTCIGAGGLDLDASSSGHPARSTRNATPATAPTTPGIASGLANVATRAAALDAALAVLVVATAAPRATARRRTERWTRARASEDNDPSPRLAASINARAVG